MSEQRSNRAPLRPPTDPQERLKFYRLDRFVKELPKVPPVKRDMHFDPNRADVKQFYIRVPVESLADLKLWMGFPNDHIDHLRYWQHLKSVPVPLPNGRKQDVLADVPRQVIANAEHNVLCGFVDEVLLAHPFWKAIADGLLGRFQQIYILCLGDLIVEDLQTVTFSNTPTGYFNTVKVFGSGSIVLQNPCKLIANVVEYVPRVAL
jgi:hypothetical protein